MRTLPFGHDVGQGDRRDVPRDAVQPKPRGELEQGVAERAVALEIEHLALGHARLVRLGDAADRGEPPDQLPPDLAHAFDSALIASNGRRDVAESATVPERTSIL
jgi:hypothetical protein